MHPTEEARDTNVLATQSFVLFLDNVLGHFEDQEFGGFGRVHLKLKEDDLTLYIALTFALYVFVLLQELSSCRHLVTGVLSRCVGFLIGPLKGLEELAEDHGAVAMVTSLGMTASATLGVGTVPARFDLGFGD